MKTITVVARDFGGAKGLTILVDHLYSQGWRVKRYLGMGKPIEGLEGIEDSVRESDVVICAMSSSPELAEPEMQAAQLALAADKPFGFFADTFNSHTRAWLQQAAFLFVLNDAEAWKAAAKFPGLNIIASGNPAWEEYAFPSMSR